jgi:acyl-CoA dehydrogenase
MMDMQELIAPFSRLVQDICSPAEVRKVEQGEGKAALWQAFEDSGFLDALVDEEFGGAGLSLAETAPLVAVLGYNAVPLPVGDTMVARALLAKAGQQAPHGPIALAGGATFTPLAQVARHVLTGSPEAPAVALADGDCPDAPALRPIAGVLRALLISGAADRVMELTAAFANERSQFGKPIGKQQAVQQQLAVLAEQAVAARIAAAIGARGGLFPQAAIAAIAKHGTSCAAVRIAAIAHAVHGAIGISEEFDLQLLTRRLHEWRLADGSESYWAQVLGDARTSAGPIASADFIRSVQGTAAEKLVGALS